LDRRQREAEGIDCVTVAPFILSRDWWHDPDAWTERLVDDFAKTWSVTAHVMDESFIRGPRATAT
jgi:hypothetical protein